MDLYFYVFYEKLDARGYEFIPKHGAGCYLWYFYALNKVNNWGAHSRIFSKINLFFSSMLCQWFQVFSSGFFLFVFVLLWVNVCKTGRKIISKVHSFGKVDYWYLFRPCYLLLATAKWTIIVDWTFTSKRWVWMWFSMKKMDLTGNL